MTLQESAEEVVYLHECTATEGRRIRAEAIKAGLARRGATLAEALHGRLRWALKMKLAKA